MLCLTLRTRTLASEVLRSTPWHEPSQSPPLVPPKSLGRLHCWVTSGQTTNKEGTQPHPSADRQSVTELCSPDQHPALPTTSPSHQETCTNLLDSLIHQREDSRSKKNYNPEACGTKTTFTERDKMKRQRAMYQMKEQNKTPEKQLNEAEIGNLPEK